MKEIHDIYDRVAKRCLSLSPKTTIYLINGLYHTDYSPDSTVIYNWTENNDDELHRTLADTIITINGTDSYHMEFQMTKDGDLIFRVFEYGFHHAIHHRSNMHQLHFPEPVIIYLYDRESFPDEYELEIFFGKNEPFLYRVPVFKYLKTPLPELDKRNLIAFIPFQLLQLRRDIEKERSAENIAALKKLILHDILNSINTSLQNGIITYYEAIKLGNMVLLLYRHIYSQYEELKKEGIEKMAEKALIFDIDILEYKIKNLEKSNDALISQTDSLKKELHILKEAKHSLEEEKNSLEDQKSFLEEHFNVLEMELQILRRSSRGESPESISRELQLPLNRVLEILHAE